MRDEIKRLSIDIPMPLHIWIRTCAKQKNMTITRWVLRALWTQIKNERIEE
jgi:hypothetical protein